MLNIHFETQSDPAVKIEHKASRQSRQKRVAGHNPKTVERVTRYHTAHPTQTAAQIARATSTALQVVLDLERYYSWNLPTSMWSRRMAGKKPLNG